MSRFELIDNETSEIIKVNDLGYPIKLNGEQLELIGNKYEHLLRKKDKAKLKSYRKEIFLKVGLKLSNSLNESEKLNKRLLLNVKTSSDDELDDAILDFFNIKSDISKFQASSLDKIGLLNTSICPLCGLFPIGNDALWKYYWSWKGGTKLCICKDCYSKGLGKQKKSKGCYVATVAYGNENHDSVLTLKSFRDVILIRTYFGPRLIDIYYRFSPKIASKLEGQVLMNLFIKVFILNPIVRFIKLFYNL